MKKIEENLETLKGTFLPFIYNDAVIFSIEMRGIPGMYGIRKNSLYFEEIKTTLDVEASTIISIEIPETTEEMVELIQVAEFAIQKIAMTSEIIPLNQKYELIKESPGVTELLRPFINFITRYEKTTHIIEGIKHGIV